MFGILVNETTTFVYPFTTYILTAIFQVNMDLLVALQSSSTCGREPKVGINGTCFFYSLYVLPDTQTAVKFKECRSTDPVQGNRRLT